MRSQRQHHAASLADPSAFWLQAAGAVEWMRPPTVGIGGSAEQPQWFADGTLNTAFNAVDRHVESGHGDRAAVIWDSAMTESKRMLTYSDLQEQTKRLGGALERAGVEQGDRVLISMPMVPEAVVAMLACARIGAVHCVVFGGFAANELAVRIDDTRPKLILVASCGLEPRGPVLYQPLVRRALELADFRPDSCVYFQRPQAPADLIGDEVEWEEFQRDAQPAACAEMAATDPLYILHTSGTTGKPKGVVREQGGHAVALTWSMKAIYDVSAGDVFWAASDIGWVVGHSYIVYGPLLAGATTILYEGKPVGTPDAGAFWRVVEEHGVSALFTAPTALRAIKQVDPGGELLDRAKLASLRALFLAGERLDPDTLHWARELLQVPVVDHWWQTETGWPVAASCLGLGEIPGEPGSAGSPVPGWDIGILDEQGAEFSRGQEGNIAIRLPLPPGATAALWGSPERFRDSYLSTFPGWYATGDGGFVDEGDHVFVMGRTDDVINVSGHRLSTGAIEGVVSADPHVAESAVIGVSDPIKGQMPVALVVLKNGVDCDPAQLAAAIKQRVRGEIGPIASLASVTVVDRLPKTRSGKVLRGTLRAMAVGRDVVIPPTIEDPNVLDEMRKLLAPELDAEGGAGVRG